MPDPGGSTHPHRERLPAARYLSALERWRAGVLAVAALLALAAVLGVTRLELASDYEIYFEAGDPQLDRLHELQATFSRNDNILFALAAKDGDVFSVPALTAVRALTAAAWELPHAVRVDSVTNFQHVSSDADEVRIRELVPGSGPITPEVATRARERALGEPALLGQLLSPGGDVTGVNVRLAVTGDERSAVLEAATAAHALAERIDAGYPGVSVRLTGNAMLSAAFPEASVHDITHLTPVMYLVIALGVAILLRSWQAALLALSGVGLACLLAMGAAGWAGIVVSSASVAAPTIITTVAIAYSMHLIAGFARARAAGQGVRGSVEQTLSVNLKPVAVTALTTVVGFLSLNASEAPPFRDLGNVTAFGVLVAFIFSVTVLPLVLLGWRRAASSPPVLDFEGFSRWIVARGATPLLPVAAVLLASASAIPFLELNDAFVEYFDQRVAFRRDTDFVMSRLTGIYKVEYAVKAQGDFGVNDPAYLRDLDRFVTWLEAQPEVMHVSAITEVLKRLNRHVGSGTTSLPASRDEAAQFLLLYEMSVPFGLDLNDRLSVDRSASRVSVTLRNLDNAALRRFESRAGQWLADNVPPHMRSAATGPAVMFAYIAERNIRAMVTGTLLAVMAIAVCLAAVFRSVRMGLVTLLPNVIPAVIAFGIWAVAVGQIGVALAVVAAMSLGIVVDDTVHFTSSFRHARRRWGFTPEEAVRHAFEATGTALASTSIVLVLGFGVLSLSAFQVNHGMGQLTSLIIACALAVDFLMLPGLLIVAARRGWA